MITLLRMLCTRLSSGSVSALLTVVSRFGETPVVWFDMYTGVTIDVIVGAL